MSRCDKLYMKFNDRQAYLFKIKNPPTRWKNQTADE